MQGKKYYVNFWGDHTNETPTKILNKVSKKSWTKTDKNNATDSIQIANRKQIAKLLLQLRGQMAP